MISVDEARANIFQAAKAIGWFEVVDLHKAYNRIAAEDCIAKVDVPPDDNSAMDGYAVQLPLNAQRLPLSQTVAAGDAPVPLAKGSAARIFTGAILPEGANAVVMQESCEEVDGHVRLVQAPKLAENVRGKGQDIEQGSCVVKKGHLLDAVSLGVLASCGIDKVTVIDKPRVAIVCTGSELVDPGKPLKRGQIYSSNPFFLTALLTEWGCDVTSTTRLPDNLEQTRETLQVLAESVDLILTSGGVSVGDEDHVKAAIDSLGVIDFWKICMKPGKPLAFGRIDSSKKSVAVIALPGNPVSAFVTATLFAKPFIEGLLGREHQQLKPLYAPANFTTKRVRQRPEYIRARLSRAGIMPFHNQSSGVLTSIQASDALALIPQGKLIHAGEPIEYFPLHNLTHLKNNF